MDKDIKILGLVFSCLIILFLIGGNITGSLTLSDLRFWRADTTPTTLKYVKPAEDVQPQTVETTQFKTAPISECSNILTKDQCNTLCGSYFTDVLYDVPVIAEPSPSSLGKRKYCNDEDDDGGNRDPKLQSSFPSACKEYVLGEKETMSASEPTRVIYDMCAGDVNNILYEAVCDWKTGTCKYTSVKCDYLIEGKTCKKVDVPYFKETLHMAKCT